MRKSLAIFLAVLLTLGIPGMGVSAAGSSVTVAADKAVYYLDAGETAANLTLTATGVLGTARYTISVAKDAGAPTTSSPELLPNSNTHAWTLPFSGTGKYEVTVSILELDESMGFSETCHASAVFTVRNHAKVAFDQPLPSVYAGPEATLPITLSGFIADDAPITLTGPTQPDGTADSRQLAGNGPETVVLKDLAIGQRTATVEAAGVEPALAYSTDQVEFDVLPNALSLTMGGPYKLHDTGVTIRAELGATYTADDATIDIQVDGLTGGTLTQYGSYAELVFDADDLSEEVPHAYAVTATAVDNATSIVLSDEAAAEIGIGLYEAAVASAAPAYKVDETAAFTATLDKFPVADAEAEFYLDGALFATEDISTGTATAAIDLAAEGVDVGTHAVAAKVFVQGEEYSALSAEESFDVELYDLTFSAGPYYLNGTDASLDVALTNYGGSTPEIEYVITGPGGPFGPYLSDGNTTDVTIDLPAEGIGAGIYEVSAKATLNGLLLAQDNAPMEVIRYNLDVADASFMIDDATAKLEATSDYGDFDEVLFSIDGYGDELALGNELPIDPVAIGPGSYTVTAKAYVGGVLFAETTADATLTIALYDLTVADASYMIDDDPATLEATSVYGDFDEVLFSIDGYGDDLALGNELSLELAAIGPGSYTVTAKAYVSGVLYAETTADATLAIALYDLTVNDESYKIDDDPATLEATSAYGVFDEVTFSIDGYGDVSASSGNTADLDLAAIGPGSYTVTAKAYVSGVLYAETTADATLAIALYDLTVADESFMIDDATATLEATSAYGVFDEVLFSIDGYGDVSASGGNIADLDLAAIGPGSFAVTAKAYVGGVLYAETTADATLAIALYDLDVADASFAVDETAAQLDVTLTGYAGATPIVEYFLEGDNGTFGPFTSDGQTTDVTVDLTAEGIPAGSYQLSVKAYVGTLLIAETAAGAEADFSVEAYDLGVGLDASEYFTDGSANISILSNYAGPMKLVISVDDQEVLTEDNVSDGDDIPLAIAGIGAGQHSLTAKAYDGNDVLLAEFIDGAQFDVKQYGMTVSSDKTDYKAGEPVVLTAQLDADYLTNNPAGGALVDFYLNEVLVGTQAADVNGEAILTLNSLAVAGYTLSAKAESDPREAILADTAGTAFVVSLYGMTLSTDATEYYADDTATLTATIAGYTPSASAEIKFYDETGALLASQSLAAATASADWANLVMGSHSATAIVFDPASGEADGRIAASTPAAFAVKYYALSLATSHPGYFTDDATGEVTATLVKDDGAAFAGSGSAQFGTLGNAAFAGDTAALGINPSALGAGTHTIEVTPKNGSVQLAQAETISFRVDTAPTLTLTKDKTTYYAGEKAVITATIANNTGAGKVVFYVGNAAPKEVALTDGKATLKLDYLQEGSLTIKASVLLEAPYEKAFSAPDLTFSIGPMILQPFWPTLDDMPTSVSIKRRFYKGNDYFTKFDSDDVKWTVSNSKKFTIDPDTGFITFKRFGGIGRVDVTATDLNGKPIKTCTVTLKWMWYEWICVVLFFGWIYL